MADPTAYNFPFKDITELLIRKANLHEGIWALTFHLGMGPTNIPPPAGGDPLPGVIVQIAGIGLQKVEKETHMALDAAKVNPA